MAATLGLDVGTTSVRALVAGPCGRVLGRAREVLPTRHPGPGQVEQDPAELFEQSVSVLRAALRSAGVRPKDVTGLGIATKRASAVAWDAVTGRPLSPVIGWRDRRAEPRARELARRGIAVGALPSALEFEWLLRDEPRVADAARRGRLRPGTPDAWLHAGLSGGPEAVTDPTAASCTALSTRSGRRWSRAALAGLGIDEAWLPRIAASAGFSGRSRRGLLGAAPPLAGRAGDRQAASFAWGVREERTGHLSLGTSAMLEVVRGGEARPQGRACTDFRWWTFPVCCWPPASRPA